MKATTSSLRSVPYFLALGGWLALAAVEATGQTPFRVGSIVTTNFTMQNRFRWTNDNGQVFTPSNSAIRLSDFDGKIVFYIFFDVW